MAVFLVKSSALDPPKKKKEREREKEKQVATECVSVTDLS